MRKGPPLEPCLNELVLISAVRHASTSRRQAPPLVREVGSKAMRQLHLRRRRASLGAHTSTYCFNVARRLARRGPSPNRVDTKQILQPMKGDCLSVTACHPIALPSYWCQPERSYVKAQGMMKFSGAALTYQVVATGTRLCSFAEIRESPGLTALLTPAQTAHSI